MLTICTWLWGDKFNTLYLYRLCEAVARHLKEEHNFICVTDRPDKEMDFVPASFEYTKIPAEDMYLTKIKGCFARLRMFDPAWQRSIGVSGKNDRLVCIDLDTVITGNLDPLVNRPEPFVIMQGGNSANPCPYNGAMMMIRPGVHPEIWGDFSVEAASKVPFYEFPDDQGWIAAKCPNAAGWQVGKGGDGVYVYKKRDWPQDDSLPKDARLVTFVGKRNPADLVKLPWIQTHWVVRSGR